MSNFYDLRVNALVQETKDCVSIGLEVPAEHQQAFQFIQGQYLTFEINIGGEKVRRSYSICSSPLDGELRVAVKRLAGGKMSTFLTEQVKVGDVLHTMVPFGNFHTTLNAFNRNAYYFFAAGSGITPILSHVKTILAKETQSKVVLFYGNRSEEEVIFKGALDGLAQQYPGQFELVYVFSKPKGQFSDLQKGRITPEKAELLLKKHVLPAHFNPVYFVCGPTDMLLGLKQKFQDLKIDAAKVHIEFFSAPVTAAQPGSVNSNAGAEGEGGAVAADVTFVCDGEEKTIFVPANKNLLDAALEANIDASFACRGGSCCTCRAKITEGKADMLVNYALLDSEVEEGFVLTCQAFALTPKLRVDYDRGK